MALTPHTLPQAVRALSYMAPALLTPKAPYGADDGRLGLSAQDDGVDVVGPVDSRVTGFEEVAEIHQGGVFGVGHGALMVESLREGGDEARHGPAVRVGAEFVWVQGFIRFHTCIVSRGGATVNGHGQTFTNLQAVGAGWWAKWPGALTPQAGLATLPRTNERKRAGGRIPRPIRRTLLRVRLVRGVRGRARVLLREVLASGVRLIRAENPGRSLRFDRTRERPAEESANELPIHAEFGREFLGTNGRGILRFCHDFLSFVQSDDRTYPYRSAFVRSRQGLAFVPYTIFTIDYPPHRPPRSAHLTWRRNFCRAKRAGCLSFVNFRASIVA